MTLDLVLVGNGAWGKNYVSTLANFSGVNLQVATRQNWKSLIDNRPDGVMICTPPDTHVELASYALKRGIPTMIEKPLCLSLAEAEILEQFGAPILVNHIHLFSEAYQNLRDMSRQFPISKIVSLGFNNGPTRPYSSLWDYGCHDLSMILDLAQEMPQNIDVQEMRTDTGSLFNIKMDFGTFDTESLVGNGGQKRVRKLKIECGGLKVEYDDTCLSNYRSLPLTNALCVFQQAILGMQDYRLGLDLPLKVLKVLEICQERLSLTEHH
jgi:predicted dehydrogenase